MELPAKRRTALGKQVKRLRREGFIPAELYGHGAENFHLTIPAKEFLSLYRKAGTHTVIDLVLEDGKKFPALIAAVATHPTSDEILAIDFHQVKKGEKVKAKVPLAFEGTAPAAKAGYLVVETLHELEAEALPEAMPHRFTVDISSLEHPGQSIHVRELPAPEGVKVLTPPDTVVATVREKRKVEAAETPAPAAEVPEVAGAAGTPPAEGVAEGTEEKKE